MLSRLGPLEQRLLRILWARGDATAREVLEDENVKVAYTTVMTTLDRLYKKHVLTRGPDGRAFRYKPRFTQAEMLRGLAGQLMRQLLGSSASTKLSLSYFVEAVTEHDVQLLDELQQLVAQKRHKRDNR